MSVIVRRVLDDLLEHARADSPRECCGLLIGREDVISASVRARNLAEGLTRFLIDPRDHFEALRSARADGLDVIGFYHSHPRSAPYPSPTDMAESGYAEALHVIVGIDEAGQQQARMFRIGSSEIVEVGFRIA